MVVNAMCLQHAMQPEPIISGLVAGHHFDWPAQFPSHAAADSLDQFKQRLRIACLHLVTAGLLGQGRLKTQDPTGFAQLDCNKAVRRVFIGCGGRSVLQGLPLVSPMRLMVDKNRTGTTSSATPA
jgi:hypothetical protein